MKLNKYTRKARREYKDIFGKTLILKTYGRITFAFYKTGPGRGKIAWSIHSKTDGEFHRKYGEYTALERLWIGGMPVECDFGTNKKIANEYIEEMLFDFANIISEDV